MAESKTVTPDNGWIKCSERLPEKDVDVLVSIKEKGKRFHYVAYNLDGHWYTPFERLHFVTHWQPINPPTV